MNHDDKKPGLVPPDCAYGNGQPNHGNWQMNPTNWQPNYGQSNPGYGQGNHGYGQGNQGYGQMNHPNSWQASLAGNGHPSYHNSAPYPIHPLPPPHIPVSAGEMPSGYMHPNLNPPESNRMPDTMGPVSQAPNHEMMHQAPAKVTQAPSEVSHAPQELSRTQHEVSHTQHEVSHTQHDIPPAQMEVSPAPHTVSPVPLEVSPVPPNVSPAAQLEVSPSLHLVTPEASDILPAATQENTTVSELEPQSSLAEPTQELQNSSQLQQSESAEMEVIETKPTISEESSAIVVDLPTKSERPSSPMSDDTLPPVEYDVPLAPPDPPPLSPPPSKKDGKELLGYVNIPVPVYGNPGDPLPKTGQPKVKDADVLIKGLDGIAAVLIASGVILVNTGLHQKAEVSARNSTVPMKLWMDLDMSEQDATNTTLDKPKAKVSPPKKKKVPTATLR